MRLFSFQLENLSCTFQMVPPLSHKEALRKVCAVCTNLNGEKACREVTEQQAELIRSHVFAGRGSRVGRRSTTSGGGCWMARARWRTRIARPSGTAYSSACQSSTPIMCKFSFDNQITLWKLSYVIWQAFNNLEVLGRINKGSEA